MSSRGGCSEEEQRMEASKHGRGRKEGRKGGAEGWKDSEKGQERTLPKGKAARAAAHAIRPPSGLASSFIPCAFAVRVHLPSRSISASFSHSLILLLLLLLLLLLPPAPAHPSPSLSAPLNSPLPGLDSSSHRISTAWRRRQTPAHLPLALP